MLFILTDEMTIQISHPHLGFVKGVISIFLLTWIVLIPSFIMSVYSVAQSNSQSTPRFVVHNYDYNGVWSGEDVVYNTNGPFRVNKTVTLVTINQYGIEGVVSWTSETPIGHAGFEPVKNDSERIIGIITEDGEIALVEVSQDNGIFRGRIGKNGFLHLTQWQTREKPLVSHMILPPLKT